MTRRVVQVRVRVSLLATAVVPRHAVPRRAMISAACDPHQLHAALTGGAAAATTAACCRRLCCCPPQVEEGTAVAIYGEGKEHAMAVGLTKMSTAEIRQVNKGIGVENVHYLNDGLWKTVGFAA